MAKRVPHKTLYVRIPPELHEAIEKLAHIEKRSVSLETEYILEKYAREKGDYVPAPVPVKAQPKSVSVGAEMADELRRRAAMPEDTDLTTEEIEADIDQYIDQLFAEPQPVEAS